MLEFANFISFLFFLGVIVFFIFMLVLLFLMTIALLGINKRLAGGITTHQGLAFDPDKIIGQSTHTPSPFRDATDQYRLYLLDEWAAMTGMTIEQARQAVKEGRLQATEREGQTYVVPPRVY